MNIDIEDLKKYELNLMKIEDKRDLTLIENTIAAFLIVQNLKKEYIENNRGVNNNE